MIIMQKIIKTFILFILLTSCESSFSQIGGLSGSKLISYTVDVVDNKNIEFEPSFYHFEASQYWNSHHRLQNLYTTPDTIRMITGMAFRFTYGMWNKLETGLSVSTDLSLCSFGIRYILMQKQKTGIAFITGVNIPFGNRSLNKKIRLAENTLSAGAGIVSTFSFTNNLSFDINAQYMRFLSETEDHDKGRFFFSGDIGYYIFKHTLQFIGSTGFSTINNDEGSHQVLIFEPGFTVETGKNFIIVIGFPFDVYGKNEVKNRGFTFALTITLH